MFAPMLISSIFVLGVVMLCLNRPDAGRSFLGIFFLIMAIAVNGSITFSNPQAYIDYAGGAMIPFYRDIALTVVEFNPLIFGVLLMAFEIAMGLALLHKGRSVKIGLIGTMAFLVVIAPLSLLQIPWLGLLIGQAYLLSQNFDTAFVEVLRSRLGRNKS